MDPNSTEPPSIELKLISCKDLRAFNFFQKLTLYGVVSIDSDDPKRELNDEQKQLQRTQTDRETDGDGGCPEWNHVARFHVGWVRPSILEGSGDLFFRFEFRHEGVLLGDKLIGECRVPVSDLVRDAVGGDADVARFVSYEVRSGEGKPNGIFNFSYTLKGIGNVNGNQHYSSNVLEGRISGYPVLDPADCDPSQSLVQYPPPMAKIESTCCYAPPPVTSYGEFRCYYPPPSMLPVPPPPPYPYLYPPHPPVAQGVEYYPQFGPGAHPWVSGPSFEHGW